MRPRRTLHDDGMSYGDYVEQLTYLLFLKMADERSRPPYSQPSLVPADYAWPRLLALDGDALFDHYRHTLERLGTGKGTLGLIFGKAQNKFDSRRLQAAQRCPPQILQGRVDCRIRVRPRAYTRSPGGAADFSPIDLGAAVADERSSRRFSRDKKYLTRGIQGAAIFCCKTATPRSPHDS